MLLNRIRLHNIYRSTASTMKLKHIAAYLLAATVAAGCTHHIHHTPEEHHHKIPLTAYSNSYEIYAEAHPAVAGADNRILIHATGLDGFTAADSLTITATLAQTGAEPTAATRIGGGLYEATVTPTSAGTTALQITIETAAGRESVSMPITVYGDSIQAHEAAEAAAIHAANAVSFSKETSWTYDFATDSVRHGSNGSVVAAMAYIDNSNTDAITVSARTAGTVVMGGNDIVAGREVAPATLLMTIDATGLAEGNLSVAITEAEAEAQAANAEYRRKEILASEGIVSATDLEEARRRNTAAAMRLEQLRRDFAGGRQRVLAPTAGYINEVYVTAGQYVSAGTPLATISRGHNLTLTAEVPASDYPLLANIEGATIKIPSSGKTYTLSDLDGHLVGYGRVAPGSSALIPVIFTVKAAEGLIPGTYAQMAIAIRGNGASIRVPNEALVEEMGTYSVYVQLTPEYFQKRQVSTGTNDGTTTEIISGLNGNERIVTRGAVLLKLAQATGTLDAHAGHVH